MTVVLWSGGTSRKHMGCKGKTGTIKLGRSGVTFDPGLGEQEDSPANGMGLM